MKCFKCGAEVPDQTRFCGHCGTLVVDPHLATVEVPLGPGDELERVRMVLTDEFDVQGEVGRGGMGVIYEARDVALGRRVALKVLTADLAVTARSAERFKREARTVADLEHPNIVPVYRVGERGGILFIAMKFIEGRSLDGIVKEQGAMTVPVTLHVLRAAARALAYAHDRGIVHRDVKAANFLIEHDGRVLISDFGVALRASDVTLTQDGSVIGTPAFMSPEQCAGKRAGPQSDQYSLGVVAFELLAAKVPFDSDTLVGYISHHLHSAPPDLRLARDDVPEQLLAVIDRALAKEPNDRFASTRDMLAAIEAVPFSEDDRRSSEQTLRRLAHGDAVERVSTRELPVATEANTVMMPLAPRRWWAQPAVWVGAVLAVVAVGATLSLPEPSVEPPLTAAAPPETVIVTAPLGDTTAAVPAPAAGGTLRLLTSPAAAAILVDGVEVGVGGVLDYPVRAGTRRIGVRASGYAPFDTTVTVTAGAGLNLGRVVLQPREGGP